MKIQIKLQHVEKETHTAQLEVDSSTVLRIQGDTLHVATPGKPGEAFEVHNDTILVLTFPEAINQ